jgi:membrane-bound serine protease (ClpP class)
MGASRTRVKHFSLGLSLLIASMLLLFSMLLAAASDAPEEPRKIVYVAQIEGIIDLGLAPYVERVIQDATEAGAVAVSARYQHLWRPR